MNGVPGTYPAGACTCGCCAGISAVTPQTVENRPGLSQIAYRVGTHGKFRQSMVAGLTSASRPALQNLRTRADSDFTLALIDAWAVASDVLTFYQERVANESFLLTATERFSLLELGRLTGYQFSPGVAASTSVAFTLEGGPGSPSAISIPEGVKIQSVPGPGEAPQTFETVKAIEARPAWNTIRALQSRPQTLDRTTRHVYLRGTSTQLKPGDAILIVGDERIDDTASERWDFRILTSVEADPDRDRTLIAWRDSLGTNVPVTIDPASESPKLFALRQRAALFGHNAPDPQVLNLPAGNKLVANGQWVGFTLDSAKIDLDAVYPGIVSESWMVLAAPDYTELSRVVETTSLSRASFAISAKVTRIVPDHLENSSKFTLRETAVFAQSEELQIVESPVMSPVFGSEIALDQLEPDLRPGQSLAVSGTRQHLRVTAAGKGLVLLGADGSTVPVGPGEVLQVLTPPVWSVGRTILTMNEFEQMLAGKIAKKITWNLRTAAGFDGAANADPDQVELSASSQDAEIVRQLLVIDTAPGSVATADGLTTLRLARPILHCYDRELVRFNANVAPATHGESVSEILGQGDASRAFQKFPLKQPPLTYVGSSKPQGFESTLEVRVNDLLWMEVPSFFEHTSRDRVYVTSHSAEGATSVMFGDGKTGAHLPTGTENVRASYRKGIGISGLVKAGQLSQLMTRPLGVTAAINPEAAAGAADPESLEVAREQAPLSVRTLGRAVSVQDYEDFARAFIGVAKAQAIWVWDGRSRLILLTVAGTNGAAITEGSDLHTRLVGSLSNSGDPFVHYAVKPHRGAKFAIEALIKVDEPLHVREVVMEQVQAILAARFSFGSRRFGQSVALSEVYAAIHETPGVLAADIDEFYRLPVSSAGKVGKSAKKVAVKLSAEPAHLDDTGALLASELLTIDLSSSKLTVMP